MSLPNIRDYVRIHPPYASVVVGRSPLIKWHDTRNGALRSAIGFNNTCSGDPEKGQNRYSSYAINHVAIARVEPNGDLVIEREWLPGQEIR